MLGEKRVSADRRREIHLLVNYKGHLLADRKTDNTVGNNSCCCIEEHKCLDKITTVLAISHYFVFTLYSFSLQFYKGMNISMAT